MHIIWLHIRGDAQNVARFRGQGDAQNVLSFRAMLSIYMHSLGVEIQIPIIISIIVGLNYGGKGSFDNFSW